MNRITQHERRPGAPRLIAFGGGGGGVGRSTAAIEIGRFLQRRSLRVLVVDAALHSPSLHVRLELGDDRPRGMPGTRDGFDAADWVAPAGRQRPAVLVLADAYPTRYDRPDVSAAVIVAALRALDFDVVIVDLPAGGDPLSAELFALSDVPVLVTATEPVPVHETTGFMRAVVQQALAAHPTAAGRERDIVRAVLDAPVAWDVDALVASAEAHGVGEVVRATLRDLEVYVLLTFTRESAERDLGQVLSLSWFALLGVRPRYIGALDHDDRRWFHVRQDNLAPALGSDRGTGVMVDEVGARLASVEDLDAQQPRRAWGEPITPIELLGVSEEAEPLEVRQAYRKLWEGLRRDSVVTQRLLDGPRRDALVARLEEANRELQTWLAERSLHGRTTVDLSLAPIVSSGEHPGIKVARARERVQISLRELSLRTRIGLRYLEAIERFELDALPRAVYLRGYLREVARALELDPEPLLDAYLSALSDARRRRILSRD